MSNATEPTPVTRPLVTIAVATFDDEARIEPCLRCALGQDYPKDRIEIFVADAMSMDATREIVHRIAGEDPRVRLLDNTERTRASALNVVLEAGSGDILIPMDPGGEFGKTHVSKCVAALEPSSADQLAVIPRTAGRTLVERALSAAQKTRLAFAAGAELTGGVDQNAPALLAAVKRSVFRRVGLFDPHAPAEEDVELSARVTRAGGHAPILRRDIVVHRADARSFRDLFGRHYQLGRSRGRRVVKERRIGAPSSLAPLALVVVGGALAATSTIQPITPVAILAYAFLTGAAAVRVSRGEGIVTVPVAWAAYPVMHLAHGLGFGGGLVGALKKAEWKEQRQPEWPASSVDAPADESSGAFAR